MTLTTQSQPVVALPYRLTSQLATEIHDSILYYFHDSKTTLSKFSTVNKVFLRLCRQHLFFSLNLRPSLTTQLLSSSHALQTVVPHIRSVALGGHCITKGQEGHSVMHFVKRLDRLEQLQLETWTLDRTSTSLLCGSLVNHYQTLTILDLKYIRFPSSLLLIQFIGNLIMLEDLSLDNVTWDRLESSPHLSAPGTPASAPSRLKKLAIVSCHNSLILSWFSRSRDLEDDTVLQIAYLRLPDLLPKEVPVLSKLLQDIGPALRRLELGILPQTSGGGSRTMHEAFGSIDLGYNTGLRTLEIHQMTLYQLMPSPPAQNCLALVVDSESPYANVISLLSSVSSQLEEATFHIWLSEEWHLDWINWVEVAGVFSNRERTRLHRLGIQVRGMGKDRGDVRAWIGQRLKNEFISSVLDVSFDD